VTRKDYDDVLVPAVMAALQQHEKVRLYYEITPQFSGMDPGAIWEDFIVGIEHLLRWERVAVITDVAWIRHTVNAFRFRAKTSCSGAAKTSRSSPNASPLSDRPVTEE
jgi:hypothetical protein